MIYGFFALALVAVLLARALGRARGRAQALARLARRRGVRFSTDDVAGVRRLRFDTFSTVRAGALGDGIDVTALVSRPVPGTSGVAHAFDFARWVDLPVDDRSGGAGALADLAFGFDGADDRGTTHRRQYLDGGVAAVVEVDAYLPHLHVVRERLATRLLGVVGLPDLDLESDELNRSYRVLCADRDFAFLFLDAPMLDLLLSSGCRWSLEALGRYVLLYGDRGEPAELFALLDLAADLPRRVPELVKQRHPTAADRQLPGWEPMRFDPLC